MIILLSEDCPLFEHDSELPLVRVLQTITDGRHLLASPPPERLKRLTSDHVWSLFGVHLTQSYKKVVDAVGRWTRPADCAGCHPKRLAEFCALPTLLLVENATTDGGFVRAIVRALRPRLGGHFVGADPRIEIGHGGGVGELPKEISRRGQQYAAVRPRGDIPARVVILADSDAPMPDCPSKNASEILRAAHETGSAAHILRKRSIENYVPDGALRSYSDVRRDQRAAVQVIMNLPPAARDHYPMKKGLAEKDRATGLYPEHVPDGVKLDIIADLLANFSHTLEAHDLRLRDGADELDRLLDLLEDNL